MTDMLAHKFLEGLIPADHREEVVSLAVMRAQKFYFGEIPTEPGKETAFGHTCRIPLPSEVEFQAWEDGLLPLPFPLVWYECLIEGERNGLLIIENPSKDVSSWAVTRLTYFPQHRSTLVSPHTLEAQYKGGEHFQGLNVRIHTSRAVPYDLNESNYDAYDMAAVNLAIYLTVMISSRTTEVDVKTAPKMLNKGRIKKGRPPLFEHRVVRIVPHRYIDRPDGTSGVTRNSPRLHWRRSHVRTLHKGTDQEKKVLISRFLVGKKELGEITHDYVVA